MYDILEVTAQYSNAVLVAVLPLVTDFATKLDLPITKPVVAAQVREFRCSWRSDIIGGLVVLTNGYQFGVLHGIVGTYRSPQSYYSLQNPDLIPKFYGEIKISEAQAVQIARGAIKKLGHAESVLSADRKPVVEQPQRIGKQVVPRYRITWADPDGRDPAAPTVRFEVDASNKRIQMLSLHSPKVFRPEIKVGVQAPVARLGPRATNQGGRKVFPVSQTFSNAFLAAIMPQFNDYIKKTGFELKLPITTNQVDMARYICGLVDNDPMATVHLKTGERFVYRHGQVIAFYTRDVAELPGEEQKPEEQFYGSLNVTKNEAISLVRKVVTQLGYSVRELHLDKPPEFYPPENRGKKSFARYFLNWKDPSGDVFLAVAELDATTKKIKSLYINDHANTNIWREPPALGMTRTELLHMSLGTNVLIDLPSNDELGRATNAAPKQFVPPKPVNPFE